MLDKEEEKKIENVFINQLVSIVDKDEMESLVGVLFSDSEKLMMAKRLMAFVLIDEGLNDVQIAKLLHLTRFSASRFRLIYKNGRERNEPVVEVVRKLRLDVEFKKLIKEVLFKYVIPASLGKIPKRGLFG